MRAPWSQLFPLTFYIAAFNVGGVEAINCSAITVPLLETYFYDDNSLTVGWSHTVTDATYSITSCCIPDPDYPDLNSCSKCPNYSPVPGCNITESSTLCTYAKYTRDFQMLHFNLTMVVPGCKSKSENSSKYIHPRNMRMTPVTKLELRFDTKKQDFSVSWVHDQPLMILCYYYRAFEYLDTGERKMLQTGKVRVRQATVRLSDLHPYKHFEFCVKILICNYNKEFSEERCVKKRSPPAAPSKPLKILCGQKHKKQSDCPTVTQKKERNVTLIWELPEKSSWNGVPTVIKIKMKLTSKEENSTKHSSINANKTNHTLKNLKTDGRYDIQLQFCSSGGDGPPTTPVVLFEQEVEEPDTTLNDPSNKDVGQMGYIIIAITSVLVITAVIIIAVYLLRRSKRKQSLASLPHLQQPSQDSAQTGTDPSLRTNPADYDFLSSQEPNIVLDLPDNESNGSSSCPLVIRTPDTSSSDSSNGDVTYYPEKPGDERGALMPSGDRSSNV